MDAQNFTHKSLEAIQQAQNIALENSCMQIEEEHLAEALLQQEGGLIPQLLQKMGLDSSAVLSAVEDFYADLMTAVNDCDAPTVSMEDAEKYEQQEFEYATARAIPALQDIGVQPRAVRLVGNPGDAIARYANKEKLDLVVMGSHGFTNFKSAVLGSVATRVAAEAECPILIIR